MDEPLVISADLYKYWQVDFQNGTIKIVGQDGRVLEEELEPEFRARDSQVATSIFDWEKVDPVDYHQGRPNHRRRVQSELSATLQQSTIRLSGSEPLADCH